jgi:hypothetical protein
VFAGLVALDLEVPLAVFFAVLIGLSPMTCGVTLAVTAILGDPYWAN